MDSWEWASSDFIHYPDNCGKSFMVNMIGPDWYTYNRDGGYTSNDVFC